jgi:hypothetical protein
LVVEVVAEQVLREQTQVLAVVERVDLGLALGMP